MKKVAVGLIVLFGLSCGMVSRGADFNGDGTNDIGIFRPSSGLWAIRGVTRVYFGSSNDDPMPGDYNGDGTIDIGIFRSGSGLWAVRGITRTYFGGSNDEPLIGIGGSGSGGSGIPVGSIISFAGQTAPSDWLLCDGSEVSRTTYAALFVLTDIAWGAGNGSSTFNLPDLRGTFLRGVDHGAGNDPDAATRIAKYTMGNIGDNVGSFQEDDIIDHTHSIPYSTHLSNPSGYEVGLTGTITGNFSKTGGETRPKNAYVNFIIKY